MRGNSRRPASLGGDDRGQTLPDYVMGVSVVLLVIVFVFGLFPSYLSPFTAGIGGDERAQADRAARTLVSNLSVEAGTNRLDRGELRRVTGLTQSELQTRWGLPETAQLNVTVRTLDGGRIVTDGGRPLAAGDPRTNRPAASATRIVTLDHPACRQGCRLTVKVW